MARRQEQKEEALVRMLRYVLGVNPAELGLVPDPEGWLPVKELLAAFAAEEGWRHVRETMVADAASRLAGELLELDGKRIRCRERTYPAPDYAASPPAHLYFGARRKAWPTLRQRGLEAGDDGRPMVLAADQQTALRLGSRRDHEPVLITVQANRALEMGAMFPAWGPEGGLYLCQWCPADCLMGPPVSDSPPEKRPARKKPSADSAPMVPPPSSTMPGSFLITAEDVVKPYKQKGIHKEIAWKDLRRKDRRKPQA